MVNNFLLTSLFVLTFSLVACNQTENANKSTTSQNQSAEQKVGYPNLEKQAELMKTAFITNDFEKSYEFMHPKIISLAGGKEKFIELSKSTVKQIEENEVKITEYLIQSPSQIIEINKQLFAVLPTEVTMTGAEQSILMKESLIAVSDDNGNNWKFIRANSKENFKKLFPETSNKLEFSEPVIEPVIK